jgi:Family of unknown function (DUF6308)
MVVLGIGGEDVKLKWPNALTDDDHSDAVRELKKYFGQEPYNVAFTGASFDGLGGGGDRDDVRDLLTAEDLVAVSMLSINFPARAALQILGPDGQEISHLLSQVPTDLDLVDVDPMLLNSSWPAWQLWSLLMGVDGVGWVTANKLVARKRPRLLPVYDTLVRKQVGAPRAFWHDLNQDLRADDKAMHKRLLRIRDQADLDISALRVFDIVTWMIGRDARRSPSRE